MRSAVRWFEGGYVRDYRESTRITVESILGKLAAGETVEQVLETHPRLNQDAVRVALAFAADASRAAR